MTTKVTVELIGQAGTAFLTGFGNPVGNPVGDARKLVNALVDAFAQTAAGHQPGHVRQRVEDSSPTIATATAAVTFATIAAGDVLSLYDSAFGNAYFTCVSTTPVLGDNTFQKVTDATATGASLAACINSSPQMRGRYTATAATGTVTITAIGTPGAMGNKSTLGKQMANPAGLTLTAFVGGRDAGSKQELQATLGANPTAAQTFLIGAKTITFVASAANQNEVTIGGSATITAASLVTVLNANTDLAGYFVARTISAAVVGIECQVSGQFGRFVSVGGTATSLAWVNAQTLVTATHFGPTTTEVNKVPTQGVVLGLRAAAL